MTARTTRRRQHAGRTRRRTALFVAIGAFAILCGGLLLFAATGSHDPATPDGGPAQRAKAALVATDLAENALDRGDTAEARAHLEVARQSLAALLSQSKTDEKTEEP